MMVFNHHQQKQQASTGHPSNHAISSQNSYGSEINALKSKYPIQTAGSVLVYWLFVSLIPVYNKVFFAKERYPYPIATAGIQLGVVALILGSWNAMEHWYRQRQQQRILLAYQQAASTSSSLTQQSTPPMTPFSWICGPHLLWKLKWCAPIGILFGVKYGVTNLGLHLVPAPTHLLLQATDLVWTVLSAYVINRERLTYIEFTCLLGCIGGSFILSWHQLHPSSPSSSQMTAVKPESGEEEHAPGMFAIFINLLSPMLLGLCIATLRLACCELMRPDNRVRGSVTAVELTTIKLCFSSVVAILLATIFERGDSVGADGVVHHHHYENPTAHASWWQAFADLPLSTKAGVTGGAILIAIFQVNCTFLTKLTSAVSVGLVGQVKIIPQWVVAAIFASLTSDYTIQGPNLAGALLIMASAAAFAGSKLYGIQHPAQAQGDGEAIDENDNAKYTEGDEEDAKALLDKLRRGKSGLTTLDDDGSTADDDDTNTESFVPDETTKLLPSSSRAITTSQDFKNYVVEVVVDNDDDDDENNNKHNKPTLRIEEV